jgi:hypothetical protein
LLHSKAEEFFSFFCVIAFVPFFSAAIQPMITQSVNTANAIKSKKIIHNKLPSTLSGLNSVLINGFHNWDKDSHVPIPTSNKSRENVLKEFMKSSQQASLLLQRMTELEKQNFALKSQPNTSFENYVIDHGTSTVTGVEHYSVNCNDYNITIVTYSLKQENTSYNVKAAILDLPNGSQIVDPLAQVQIDYQTFWFFGTVTYVEVDYIFQQYFYNAISCVGFNYNEAYAYKMEAAAVSLGVIGADVITFVAGLVIDAVNPLAGAVTLPWDAVDLYLISSNVNAAYAADITLGVLNTAPQNDYMYYGFAGVGTNGWGLHVFITGRGWVNALYPLTLSGVVSPYISLVCHDFQMNMGQITFVLDCINEGNR